MAKLLDVERIAIWTDVMEKLSQYNIQTPVSKAQFRWLVNYFDDGLETFEQNAVAGIPDGPGKTWLLANPAIARRIVVMIEERRLEVL